MSATAEENINKLRSSDSLEVSDRSVAYNTYLQLVISAVLVAIFFGLRPLIGWLYYPNIRNKEKHPAFACRGRVAWMHPLQDISDPQLLSLIGLDAFMMLQTMKLLHRILLVLSAIIIPVLGILYLNGGASDVDQYFIRLSITNVDPNSNIIYVSIVMVYLATLVILYMVYVYYKKYVGLRQTYIRNPALLTAVPIIKRHQYRYGSIDRAIESLNLPVRTLHFTHLPAFLRNDDDLRTYMDGIGAGSVVDCILNRDTQCLNELIFERERSIRMFERSIHDTVHEMNAWSEKNLKQCEEDVENFNGKNLFEAAANNESSDASYDQRIILFHGFMQGFNSFKKKKNDVSLAEFYLDRLKKINGAISGEKAKLLDEFRSDENVVEMVREVNMVEYLDDLDGDTDFLPVRQIVNPFNYYRNFVENIPVGKKSGFVTFESQKSASAISQSLLSSRAFSVSAVRAPAPNDTIWSNLNLNSLELYLNRIMSFVFFVAFVIVFLTVVFTITALTKLEYIEKVFHIEMPAFVKSQKSTIEGIIMPFVYNQLLSLSPILLTTFLKNEGIISYSEFQLRLMQRYFLFLFFNGFVALFLSDTFSSVIMGLLSGDEKIQTILKKLGKSLTKNSLFFCNTIIQKCILGNVFLLVKPIPLVTQLLIKVFQRNRTRREKVESRFPESINFGTQYPLLFLVFPMCLIYSVVSPLILGIGALHFFAAYLSLKNEFIYVVSNEFEAGGVHWNSCCNQILYSLISMHIATACQLLAYNQKLKASCVVVPMLLTIYFKVCLQNMFQKSSNFHPINVQEEDYLDSFTENYLIRRRKMLEEWVENTDIVADTLDISALNIDDKTPPAKEYPYRDPHIDDSLSRFLLPKDFFKIVKFLQKNDTKDIFQYKN